MATETDAATDAGFGRVSRVKDRVFEAATLLSSVIGIAALGVLLAYVAWDAFGLSSAEPAWYALFALFVVAPTAAFVFYARRDRMAGEAALELVATALGGLLATFAVVVVLDVIAGPFVWFAYFLTVIAPVAALVVYDRLRSGFNWFGLALLTTLLVGPVVGTLGLPVLTAASAYVLGATGVYAVSLLLPAVGAVRVVVEDVLALGDGDRAALALLAVGLLGVPVAGGVGPLTAATWLIAVACFVAPVAVVVWKNLADRERRRGFAGPAAVAVGVGLVAVVPDLFGLSGPSPWFDWQFVTSAHSRFPEQAGLYPAVVGSVFIIVLVAIITLVVGVGAAVYLEEYAPSSGLAGHVTRLIRINISNLAGVPSVVYGILGLAVFANLMGLGFGTVITAAFTLSLLILPIVIISAREAVASVPEELRHASYGMGATRWQTTREVVLPRAMPGVFTGTILALGRAIGETAPLIMIGLATTKFTPPEGLFSQTSAMPMQIFAWSDYAKPAFQHGVVAAGVVTLLIVLLTMNSIAILLRNRYEKEAF